LSAAYRGARNCPLPPGKTVEELEAQNTPKDKDPKEK
jgi:hypothetical protein